MFGSGAGTVVKQALGRRGSVAHDSTELAESPTEEENVDTLRKVPKPTRRLVHMTSTPSVEV